MSADPKAWDDGADFYSTSTDDERLEHTDIDACIEAEFNDRDPSVEKAILGGMTVKAWSRNAIDVEAEAKRRLDSFMEDMFESLADEFGDPDGDWPGGPKTVNAKAFESVALPALVTLLSTITPWRCHVIGERTFTADELLAWVRENEPDWLETKS